MSVDPRDAFSHVRFISAGAGSGKTYRLIEELERALTHDGVNPARIIGTTFTVKAAGELEGRVRARLIERGRPQLAERMAQALIGTVHSVCERLLHRFAFELGLSPALEVVSLEDGARFFNQALGGVLDLRRVRAMNLVAVRLGIEDWQSDVRRIADNARANDIGPEALAPMGPQSATSLLAFFPEAEADERADAAIESVIAEATRDIDLEVDKTKGTREYVGFLQDAAVAVSRRDCPWSMWIKLSKEGATKKSDPIAARVREVAARYDAHPRFQRDVREYVEGVFAAAARTLSRFQEIKRERGLIDFTDMEQLVLRALDEPAVIERMREELELLLVDEFQDTNPMQLAIFMKLARIADRVVFVGDVKQAIYAFRGCDPDLVFETLEGLSRAGGETDVLASSWRSRPALVRYLNAVFRRAFNRDGIPAEKVVLEPEREERVEAPAVVRWKLSGKNERQFAAIARGVADLVGSGYEVVDPESKVCRPVRWGDIVVLAATNGHVEAIARALKDARVPMKMSLQGLLSVPEVCLAKACLRRLNDSSDTLATAEVRALARAEDPETWLADRLRWLGREEDGYAWSEVSDPVVRALASLRGDITTRSPVEVVARMLNHAGLREAVTAWGPDELKAAQRLRNLDAFLNLAVEYERHCVSQHEAATLTGFLFWLENPRSHELDLQPVLTGGDAVHVLTYHKAKGLEWPVVVATDFHYEWRARLWDARVETPAGAFDVEAPLTERIVRYWPRVFGGHSSGVAVLDRIATSEEARQCEEKGASESRRLAYVGMSRARDLLVVAAPSKTPHVGAWVHTFECDWLLPAGDVLALPDDGTIPAASMDLDEGAEAMAPTAFTPTWFPEREPLVERVRAVVSPSDAEPVEGAEVGEIVDLGIRVKIHGEDMTVIGSGLHAVLAAELVNPDQPDAKERAQAVLEGYGADAYVSAEEALACARRFRAHVEERFRPSRVLAECPLVYPGEGGRVVTGWMDVLLETPEGWVIVDHKSSPRPRAEWVEEARAYSGQLRAYARALDAAGRPVAGCWVHFAVGGGMVQVSAL